MGHLPERQTRRAYIAGVAGGGVVGLAGCTSLFGESSADVSMFRYDLAHTGTLPNATGPTASVTEDWRFQISDREVFSSPAVVEETVYFGGLDGRLYAVDATEGTERWYFRTIRNIISAHGEPQMWSSPAIVDDTAYTGALDGRIYGIDLTDGTERWHFQTESGVTSGRRRDGLRRQF